ncbi:MAG: VanZ family protein [Burkholderiales bacterium]
MENRHNSATWSLAWAYAVLIGYASLYPFAGWRDQGVNPVSFLLAPWPRYWSGFDLWTNLLGYAPFGCLLALGWLRSGRSAVKAALGAIGTGVLFSLALEYLQIFLPSRVPSNLDLALNSAGAMLGAMAALLLERCRLLVRWRRLRDAWVVSDARGALVLLALWPWALLYPAPVPLALGQVLERVEEAIADWLAGTPYLEWLPLREIELQPLLPSVEWLCVSASALLPCLLAYSAIRAASKRLLSTALLLAAGMAVTALSAALSWGPSTAWVWLTPPVLGGLCTALLLLMPLGRLPMRGCVVAAGVVLLVSLGLTNQAPASPYFALTLQTWEQGRFIRFHGVVQWLSWCWPYLALLHLIKRWRSLRSTRRSLQSSA